MTGSGREIGRREFLIGAGAAWLAAMSPMRAWAAVTDPVHAAFEAKLPDHPWLLAFANAERDLFEARVEWLHGQLPEGLTGTLYRNGPARHEVAGERYQHSFDGDGVAQAFRLGADLRHQARLIETTKVKLEREAGRRLMPGFGTPPAGKPPKDNNHQNVANISVLWHADELLALWEGGDAYALDASSLATKGPHRWSPETAGMPFSAHPRRDPDGTLWNFGSMPWLKKLALYRISKTGAVEDVRVMDLAHPAMIHDFVATERHLVFLMPPLVYDTESRAATFLDRHEWRGDDPMRILVVEKDDLSKHRWLEAPASFVFHLGNAWEEANGTIHLDYCRHPNADVVFGSLRRVMWGEAVDSEPSTMTRMKIDPNAGLVEEDIGVEVAEFPSVDPNLAGARQRHVVTLGQQGGSANHPQLNAVVRHDLEDGAVERYTYPDTVMPEEHLVVPSGAGGDGWIVGTALDFERRQTQIAVFEASRLGDGPIALARLPYWLPMGLHGRFVAA